MNFIADTEKNLVWVPCLVFILLLKFERLIYNISVICYFQSNAVHRFGRFVDLVQSLTVDFLFGINVLCSRRHIHKQPHHVIKLLLLFVLTSLLSDDGYVQLNGLLCIYGSRWINDISDTNEMSEFFNTWYQQKKTSISKKKQYNYFLKPDPIS